MCKEIITLGLIEVEKQNLATQKHYFNNCGRHILLVSSKFSLGERVFKYFFLVMKKIMNK